MKLRIISQKIIYCFSALLALSGLMQSYLCSQKTLLTFQIGATAGLIISYFILKKNVSHVNLLNWERVIPILLGGMIINQPTFWVAGSFMALCVLVLGAFSAVIIICFIGFVVVGATINVLAEIRGCSK